MAETDNILSWTLVSECPIPNDVADLLVEGEVAVCAYKTLRDSAIFTNKRLIVRDAQGLTGKKVEIYSLPYSSINMWSTENAGKLFDINAEVELWTRAGMGAITTAILAVLSAGDHMVAADTIYGGTFGFIKNILPRFGIEATMVSVTGDNVENIRKAMKPNTKVVYIETPCNPTLAITDIKKAAEIAHEGNALLYVDNTFATPYLQQPLSMKVKQHSSAADRAVLSFCILHRGKIIFPVHPENNKLRKVVENIKHEHFKLVCVRCGRFDKVPVLIDIRYLFMGYVIWKP
jgi:hypothetical protein